MMAIAGMLLAPSSGSASPGDAITAEDMVPPMDPLLVITNSDAGTADDESLETALKVLRSHTSVEVQATSNRGELDSALHRAGSRWIIVAGGDGSMHAVVAALYRRNDLKDA